MSMVWTQSTISRRIYTLILCTVFFCICSTAGHGATISAKSCSLNDVRTAINSSSRGDTITVPAGSCNWNDTLVIPHSLTLQGAGSSATKITSTFQANGKDAAQPIIRFTSSTSANGSYLFRVTGFQFDCAYFSPAIHVIGSTRGYYLQSRIDNNRFINMQRDAYACSTCYRYNVGLMFHGLTKGIIDNNYLHWFPTIHHIRWGASILSPNPAVTSWDNGSDENIFIEDNTFVMKNTWNNPIVGSQCGSYVLRYNTIDYSANNGAYFYYGDTHGLQPGGSYGSFGGEVYGNKIIGPGDAEFRGGIHKVFYNKYIGATRPTNVLWETYGSNYITTTTYPCPVGSLYYGLTHGCSIDGRSMNVEKTYLWNNRYASTESGAGSSIAYSIKCGGGPYPDKSVSGAKELRANTDYWLPSDCNGNANCQVGVGCGSTLPASCTVGTGFWFTNQSCTSVPVGSFGPNPTTPISGTLYKCTTTNNWTPYYTPYTYPHPLRSDDPGLISAPKGFRLAN